MRVGRFTLKHNERSPYYVSEYIEARMDALTRTLEKRFGEENVYFEKSRHSEACYLSIRTDEEDYKISFRNHGNFADSTYDMPIYLSDFENWTECKSFFFSEVLPLIERDELLDHDYIDLFGNWQKEKRATLK